MAGNSSYIAANKNETVINERLSEYAQRQTVSEDGSVFRYLMPKEFTAKLKELFPHYKKSIDKLIPAFSMEDWLDFIMGWFDADGCSKGVLKITAKEDNIQALKVASVVLASVGIRTRLSKQIKVRLNDKAFIRRDLTIVGLESRKAFKSYFSNIP